MDERRKSLGEKQGKQLKLEVGWKVEAGWKARLKGNRLKNGEDAEYISITLPNGRKYHGGNQSWWLSEGRLSKAEKQEFHKKLPNGMEQTSLSRYQKCRRDENYRIASLGCGVIAMTNLELYIGQRNAEKRELRNANPEEASPKTFSKVEYTKLLKENWTGTYRIGRSYVNYMTGLYPWKMEEGLRKCLLKHHCEHIKVQWAPFVGKSAKLKKQLVLEAICDMLQADYPVVCSYHTFSPKEHSLTLYHELGLAVRGGKAEGRYDSVSSHYMTIIGCYVSETGCTILQMESWGNLYYVRYDEYAEKLNYFTNILRIYE